MRSPKDNFVELTSEQKLRLKSVFEESRIEPTHILIAEDPVSRNSSGVEALETGSAAKSASASDETHWLLPTASGSPRQLLDRGQSPVAIGKLPLPLRVCQMFRRTPFFVSVLMLSLIGGAIKEFEHPELIGRAPADLISDALSRNESPDSFTFLQRAAKMGSRDSLALMACLCEGKDERKALTYYTAAAQAGDPFSTYKLAQYYLQGLMLPVDEQKSFQLHLKNAKNGFSLSALAVANMYRLGQGTEVSHTEAFRWYQAAANQEQPEAFYPLAMCFYYGTGTARNPTAAVSWLQRVSTESAAGELLGDIYSIGKDVQQDFNAARNCYWGATWAGNTSAMKKLALMYEKGTGNVQDLSQAISLYKQSGDWRAAERVRRLMLVPGRNQP